MRFDTCRAGWLDYRITRVGGCILLELPLAAYLAEATNAGKTPDAAIRFVGYLASLERVGSVSPDVARAIVSELADQRGNLKMIASENYSSLAVQLAQGTC